MDSHSALVSSLESQEKVRTEQYNSDMQSLERQKKEMMKKHEKQLQEIERRKDTTTMQYEKDLEDFDQKKTDAYRAAALGGKSGEPEDSTKPSLQPPRADNVSPERTSHSERPRERVHCEQPTPRRGTAKHELDQLERTPRPTFKRENVEAWTDSLTKPREVLMSKRGTLPHKTDSLSRPSEAAVERKMSKRGTLPHRADHISSRPSRHSHVNDDDGDTFEITNAFGPPGTGMVWVLTR